MSALKFEARRALVGSLTITGLMVAIVVMKDLGDKAKMARAAEELLAEERWAVEVGELLLPLQRRAQALLDADFPLDQIREMLKNRWALSGDDVLTDTLSRFALSVVNGEASARGLIK